MGIIRPDPAGTGDELVNIQNIDAEIVWHVAVIRGIVADSQTVPCLQAGP